ncbi:MAG: sulfur carrier protein ThiS [Verrucomicrobiae bacterium]|nr:sulfur carrier protein ThiS [Verrucomicrobiae bacterium]
MRPPVIPHPTSAFPPIPAPATLPRVETPSTPTTIQANGQSIPVTFPCTLEAFLQARHLPPRSVVVEHNGQAVAPSEFHARPLAPGDRLEIVRIVAGG